MAVPLELPPNQRPIAPVPYDADPLNVWARTMVEGVYLWRGVEHKWTGEGDKRKRELSGKADQHDASNAVRALTLLAYNSSIWLNEWTGKVMYDDEVMDLKSTSADVTSMCIQISIAFGAATPPYTASRPAVVSAIHTIARTYARNPRKEAVMAVEWDGYTSWKHLAIAMAQDPEDEFAVEVCALLVRGIVVRLMHPGADFPYAPILYSSKHGAGKTNLLKVLAGGYYSVIDRGVFTHTNMDALLVERTRGKSVAELGEFNGFSGKALDSLKTYITNSTISGVRLAFGQEGSDWPTTAILVGTTNTMDMLSGDTEHRRFPVLTIPDGKFINVNWVRENLGQLYALVLHEIDILGQITIGLVNAGESVERGMGDEMAIIMNDRGELAVRMPVRFWPEIEVRAQGHREVTALEEHLHGELDFYPWETNLRSTSVLDWVRAKNIRHSSREFAQAMTALGWQKRRLMVDGKKVTCYGRDINSTIVEPMTASFM